MNHCTWTPAYVDNHLEDIITPFGSEAVYDLLPTFVVRDIVRKGILDDTQISIGAKEWTGRTRKKLR